MTAPPPLTALKPNHDHARCIADALETARMLCKERGARLTPVRERVLEIVWQSHKPLGAYAILDVLDREGRNAMPPTVYRALDFLTGLGLVHRIASLNAYIGCPDPGGHSRAHYLICRECRTVAELTDELLGRRIAESARAQGFVVEELNTEVTGLCPACAARQNA